jgi:hypothetical protein
MVNVTSRDAPGSIVMSVVGAMSHGSSDTAMPESAAVPLFVNVTVTVDELFASPLASTRLLDVLAMAVPAGGVVERSRTGIVNALGTPVPDGIDNPS